MPVSNSINPAIVVMAYNRPHSLQRLLNSLAKAIYATPAPLIISIDKSDTDQVQQVAKNFHWEYGPKEIIAHPTNLGLRKHALACGDLTEKYEYIIFLEDDLLVSPGYYLFAQQAVTFYAAQNAVAGVSLYTFSYYEQAAIPFVPIPDDSDVYFLQYPSSWGSVLFRRTWQNFRIWLNRGQKILAEDPLPTGVKRYWSDKSWVKYYLKYLVTQQLFYAYPRFSYSTTFSDAGEHHLQETTKYQVPLQLTPHVDFRWIEFEQSYAVYDVFFEILPDRLNRLVPDLLPYEYTVDLNATKEIPLCDTPYLLTTREAKKYTKSYAYQLKPAVMNVIYQLPGEGIYLASKESISSNSEQRNNFFYHTYLTFSQLIALIRFKLGKMTKISLLQERIRTSLKSLIF